MVIDVSPLKPLKDLSWLVITKITKAAGSGFCRM